MTRTNHISYSRRESQDKEEEMITDYRIALASLLHASQIPARSTITPAFPPLSLLSAFINIGIFILHFYLIERVIRSCNGHMSGKYGYSEKSQDNAAQLPNITNYEC